MYKSLAVLALVPFVLGQEVERAGPKVLAGAPVNDIQVASQNVVQCGQATIRWIGATAPVKLQIGTGGYYVGTTWLESYEGITSDSQKWTVNQAQGTDLIFQVTDAKGQVAYQQNVDVGESSDDSCLSSKGLSSSAGVSSTAAASPAWVASSSKSSVKAASAKPSSAAAEPSSKAASSTRAASSAPASPLAPAASAVSTASTSSAAVSSAARAPSSSGSAAAAAPLASTSSATSSSVRAVVSGSSSSSSTIPNATLAAAEARQSGAGINGKAVGTVGAILTIGGIALGAIFM